MIRAFRKNRGFSLIELSLIVAIVGFLGASVLETYRGYLRTKIKNDTSNHIEVINKALVSFVTNYNRLPCPADPTLPPSNASAGVEVCTVPLPGASGVKEVNGHRRTSSNPAWTGFNTLAASPTYGDALGPVLPFDPVRIGSIPYITLGISLRDTLDGWGNRFTYAVSFYMTDKNKFNYDNGVVDVMKLEDVDVGGGVFVEQLVKATNSVSACPVGSHPATCNVGTVPTQDRVGAWLYAIVSHGRDGKGAYTYEGARPIACNSSPGRDMENCDDDRTFVDADTATGIFSTVHRPAPAYPAPGTDPDVYFDDARTAYTLARSNDKWSFNSATQMYNKTIKKVGIGYGQPQVGLHVGGNVRIDQDMRSGQYCSAAWDDPSTPANPDKPSYCFPIYKLIGLDGSLSGTGSPTQAMGCPGQIMKGIALGNAICESQADLGVLASALPCPSGQYITGIDATGSVTCAAP